MSSPISLRLCCLAAMAPALTDSTSQTRIKLSKSPPHSSPESPIPAISGGEKYFVKSRVQLQGYPKGSVCGIPNITLAQLQRVQGLLKPLAANKQSSSTNLKQIKITHTVSEYCGSKSRQISVSSQNKNLNKVNEKMNQNSDTLIGIQENGKHKAVSNGNGLTHLTDKQSLSLSTSSIDLSSQLKGRSISDSKVAVGDSKMVASAASEQGMDRGNVSDTEDVSFNKNDAVELNKDPVKTEEELSDEVAKKQHIFERRTEHLLRRLRRLQGRQLETHIRNQVGSFVSFQRRNLQSVANRSIGTCGGGGSHSELKTELLKSEDVKNLSTAALVNLVRKIQSPQGQLGLNRRVVSHTKVKEENEPSSVLTIDKDICNESSRVAGHLGTNLHHMQNALDSDATESSSGGESCDEYDEYDNDRKVLPPPLHRRAEWKWAKDRAAIASRWTWLQAQVSDLEYRIRQQSEIFKQIRHTKGCVVLGEPPSIQELGLRLRQARANGQKLSPLESKIADFDVKTDTTGSPCNISTLLMNVNKQASKLTQSLGNCLSPVQSSSVAEGKLKGNSNHSKHLNGVINSGHSSSSSCAENDSKVGPAGDAVSTPEISPASPLLEATCQAARCRPVRSYRKRKLLRTAGLHQISRKAARLSSVKCHCTPPQTTCPMCGGRYNNTLNLDSDLMPLNERVALLDPAYHPVLSFNEEIPLPIHFESLLKSGEWQNKPPPKSAKVLAGERRRQKLMVTSVRDRARKPTKYSKGAATVLLASAKLRNKYERRTPTKSRPLKSPKKKVSERRMCRNDLKRRRAAKLAIALKRSGDLSMSLPESSTCGSQTPTPSPQMKDGSLILSSSCPSSAFKELKEATLRKRRGEAAYDIDNIVIPYSMAASTRVEKLQYKEIVTPKWRNIEDEEEEGEEKDATEAEGSEEEDENEDISDEAFIKRHDICEIQERKRFSSFIQYPSRRSRGSRNEPGPATPQPMSPDVNSVMDTNESGVNRGSEDVFRKRSGTLSSVSGSSVSDQLLQNEDFVRKRSGSVSRLSTISYGLEESSMDAYFEFREMHSVEPWPERKFPLAECDYEEMILVQPPAPVRDSHYLRQNRISNSRVCLLNEYSNTPIEDVASNSSRACSPNPSSSSGSHTSEDPNDPEWTMINGIRTPTRRGSRSLKR